MTDGTPIGPLLTCQHCGAEHFNDFRFCGHCGQKKEIEDSQRSPLESKELRIIIWYVSSLLLILVVYQTTSILDQWQEDFEFVEILLIAQTLLFAYLSGKKALKLVFKPIDPGVIGLVLICAVPAAVLVHYFADFINFNLLGIEWDFPQYTIYGFAYAFLFVAVVPAIFEEMAFRGFFFTHMKAMAGTQAALVVTSIVFGISHLSIISLLWLIPLGYVFGWLRKRYGTIVYGMLAHFTYNLTIVVLEYMQYNLESF